MVKFNLSLLLGLLLCWPAMASDTEVPQAFVMNSQQAEDVTGKTWFARLYHELFNRLGMPLEVISLPPKRVDIYSQTGKLDGQLGRVSAYQQRYPDYIRVNFPLSRFSVIAFSRSDFRLQLEDGWHSLQRSQLSIGYIRDVMVIRERLTADIDERRLSPAADARQGLLQLLRGRTDLFIHAYSATLFSYLNSEMFKGQIKPLATLRTDMVYPYLHRRHAALVPELERVLREMESEGVLDQICTETLGPEARDYCMQIRP